MRLSLMILCLVVSGCGGASTLDQLASGNYNPNSIPLDASIYLDAFKMEAYDHGRDIRAYDMPIEFFTPVNQDGTYTFAQCRIETFSRKVMVNQSYWEHATTIQKEIVLYHELGHCMLARQHSLNLGADGEPLSLMYPDVSKVKHFKEKKDEYLNELFTTR